MASKAILRIVRMRATRELVRARFDPKQELVEVVPVCSDSFWVRAEELEPVSTLRLEPPTKKPELPPGGGGTLSLPEAT